MKNTIEDLLIALSDSMSAEEILLSSLKASIAADICDARIQRDLNQKEFATLLDVSQGMVSRWESGNGNFTLQTIASIASKLDLPIRSPFVSNSVTQYYTPTGNVLPIHSSATSWSFSTPNIAGNYASITHELKEM